jgi:hypothetical protein
MYDPLLHTHRELRIALRYATRELQRVTMTPRRIRLLQQSERILRESKAAAVAAGESKMPVKAWEQPTGLNVFGLAGWRMDHDKDWALLQWQTPYNRSPCGFQDRETTTCGRCGRCPVGRANRYACIRSRDPPYRCRRKRIGRTGSSMRWQTVYFIGSNRNAHAPRSMLAWVIV